MDSKKFDDITKVMASKPSRRRFLQGLAGGLTAAVTGLLGRSNVEATATETECKVVGEYCKSRDQCCKSSYYKVDCVSYKCKKICAFPYKTCSKYLPCCESGKYFCNPKSYKCEKKVICAAPYETCSRDKPCCDTDKYFCNPKSYKCEKKEDDNGACETDDDCPGSTICCPEGTDKAGRCVGHGRDGGDRACNTGNS